MNFRPSKSCKAFFERLGIGDEARIVLYGDNSGLSAARAYFTLDYLGHGARAALLDGGLEKWKTERRPISTDGGDEDGARSPRASVRSASSASMSCAISPGQLRIRPTRRALVDSPSR